MYACSLALPVRQITRFRAKVLVGLEITAVPSVLLGLVVWLLFRFNPLLVLGALLLSQLLNYSVNAFTLALDAAHPILKWMNETQAIKKSANVAFSMLIWLLLLALAVAPSLVLLIKGIGESGALLALSAGILLLEAVASELFLRWTAGRYAFLPDKA